MAETNTVTREEADHDRLQALIDLFEPLAAQADPRPVCWIRGGLDAGEDYCPDCARWVAKHQRRHHRDCRGAEADGGWDTRRESDTPAFCAGCGHVLGYCLTTHGLDYELEHFLGHADFGTLTPVDAMTILAVIEAAHEIGSPKQIASALIVADRAAPFLPALAQREAARG